MVSDFRIQLYAQEIKTNKKAKLFTRCYQVNVTGYICFVFYSFSCFACFLYLFMTISIIFFLCCCWCCWYLNLGPILPLIFWNQQHKDNTGRTSLICTIANLFLFFWHVHVCEGVIVYYPCVMYLTDLIAKVKRTINVLIKIKKR